MAEISELKSKSDRRYRVFAKAATALSERVEYGIKSDAVSLTRIRGIGRKRARVLLNHGIRDINQLISLKEAELQKIPGFGEELARNILIEAREILKETGTGLKEFDDLLN